MLGCVCGVRGPLFLSGRLVLVVCRSSFTPPRPEFRSHVPTSRIHPYPFPPPPFVIIITLAHFHTYSHTSTLSHLSADS